MIFRFGHSDGVGANNIQKRSGSVGNFKKKSFIIFFKVEKSFSYGTALNNPEMFT